MSIPVVAVSFRVIGFSSAPSAVTTALGVQPTTTWVAGDVIEPGTRLRSENGWVLQSDESSPLDLEQGIVSLLDRLPSTLDEVFKAVGRSHAEVTCGITIRDQAPAVNLGPATLQRIANLGATLDMDIVLTE